MVEHHSFLIVRVWQLYDSWGISISSPWKRNGDNRYENIIADYCYHWKDVCWGQKPWWYFSQDVKKISSIKIIDPYKREYQK